MRLSRIMWSNFEILPL